jgi:hypothetical protein
MFFYRAWQILGVPVAQFTAVTISAKAENLWSGHVMPRYRDLASDWSAAHKLFQDTHLLITSGSFEKPTCNESQTPSLLVDMILAVPQQV